jgi:hypothetical protein
MPTRKSDEPPAGDDERDRLITSVQETCVCGASYSLCLPAAYYESLLKGVNTWRKYHSCPNREVTDAGQRQAVPPWTG